MNDLERPVWIVTNDDDPTADLVIAELHRREVPVVRFDSGQFPATLTMSGFLGNAQGWQGSVRTPSRTNRLDRVRSLYYRRPSGFVFPHLDAEDARFATSEARYGMGGIVASLPGCLHVNHPHRIGDAEYKPAGLAAAVASGFDVPPTLITNEPERARQFVREHERVLYKPLSTPLYQRDGVAHTVSVEPVDVDEIDDAVGGTMNLFQEIIDKVRDVRTTVIGGQVYSVAIISDLLDWRTDYSAISYAVVETPDHIRTALYAYLAHFRLVYGAFDFAVTANNQWWLLKCNPSGQFAWLEPETGLPMVATMADLLEKGDLATWT